MIKISFAVLFSLFFFIQLGCVKNTEPPKDYMNSGGKLVLFGMCAESGTMVNIYIDGSYFKRLIVYTSEKMNYILYALDRSRDGAVYFFISGKENDAVVRSLSRENWLNLLFQMGIDAYADLMSNQRVCTWSPQDLSLPMI